MSELYVLLKMEFDTIRPIISGLIGATIAGWFAVRWLRRLPHADNQSTQRKLVKNQKGVVRAANIGAGIGIATGLILYLGGFMDDNDWRGLGLTMGVMALLPILVIIIANFEGGIRQVREGFAAYALAQKVPSAILFPLMGLMLCAGLWATIELMPTNNAEQDAAGNPLPAV